jgi:hypothetical protein
MKPYAWMYEDANAHVLDYRRIEPTFLVYGDSLVHDTWSWEVCAKPESQLGVRRRLIDRIHRSPFLTKLFNFRCYGRFVTDEELVKGPMVRQI